MRWGSHGQIEMTPEFERALNTPVSKLSLDQMVRGALRRAGSGDALAHLRLAKYRAKKRSAIHAANVNRTRNASSSHKKLGNKSRELVREEATKLLKGNPGITRDKLTEMIAGKIKKPGEDRIKKLLVEMKLPPSRWCSRRLG